MAELKMTLTIGGGGTKLKLVEVSTTIAAYSIIS